MDFARLFGRCAKGEVFSPRNVKSIRLAGESLSAAGVIALLVLPFVLRLDFPSTLDLEMPSRALASGAIAMGLVIVGLAHIFNEAVGLKEETDSYI